MSTSSEQGAERLSLLIGRWGCCTPLNSYSIVNTRILNSHTHMRKHGHTKYCTWTLSSTCTRIIHKLYICAHNHARMSSQMKASQPNPKMSVTDVSESHPIMQVDNSPLDFHSVLRSSNLNKCMATLLCSPQSWSPKASSSSS